MSAMFPKAKYDGPYTTNKLIQLIDLAENNGQSLILAYKHPVDGFSQAGECLSVYESATGNECAAIGSFANSILCSDITGHWMEN